MSWEYHGNIMRGINRAYLPLFNVRLLHSPLTHRQSMIHAIDNVVYHALTMLNQLVSF